MNYQEFQQRYAYDLSKDRLGGGGFGEVYKAYDSIRDRWVAIKIARVNPDFDSVRLKNEVELINHLPEHKNIAYYEACYTFSSFDGEYDMGILQYYEAGNLLQLIHRNPLTPEQKHALLTQLLDGLNFLHTHGIIHRDLKPQNILIVKRGNEYIPKITDFGISKRLDSNKSAVFSNSLIGAGTLAYSSPEQLKDSTIHKNTDLWSFGVIAFQLWTGELPFTTGHYPTSSEAGRQELFSRINRGVLPESIAAIPEHWQQVIRKCLIVDIEERVKNCPLCLQLLESPLTAPLSGNDKKPEDKNETPFSEEEKTRLFTEENVPVAAEVHSEDVSVMDPGKKEKRTKNTTVIFICTGLFLLLFCVPFIQERRTDFSTHPSLKDLLFPLQREEKWGYVNFEGEKVIPFQYFYAGPFINGFAIVGDYFKDKSINGEDIKWGYINKKGEQITSFKYDEAQMFSNGLAAVSINNKYGFINETGKEIVPLLYDSIDSYFIDLSLPEDPGDLLAVCLNNKWGFVDRQGQNILPFIYDKAYNFFEGLGTVNVNNRWYFINKEGKEITALDYDFVYGLKEGMAIVGKNNKRGFVNRQGNVVIPLEYDGITCFHEGYAIVKKEGKVGFIDKTGKEMLFDEYDSMDSFIGGIASVVKNGRWGGMNEKGKEVIPAEYFMIYPSFDKKFVLAIEINCQEVCIDRNTKEKFYPMFNHPGTDVDTSASFLAGENIK